ncbi:hypothetical protein BN000_00698 [Neobacillus massiliamazoniensis]|uniref:Uncharacterized protein n=1 Tax=Neobacillus massiliamazoniensis TaxID=1499688 RepID=A0A0U1NRY3_9BACI|nr:hypothetical protein BN000_00698 [Neobacillus massiliamazoniensis]
MFHDIQFVISMMVYKFIHKKINVFFFKVVFGGKAIRI